MVKLFSLVFGVVSLIVAGFFAYDAIGTRQSLALSQNAIQNEEIRSRFLADEISSLQHKLATRPTYLDGFRDAVLRAGVPNGTGSYKDGFYAAFLMLGNNSYLEGYNASRQQQGLNPISIPLQNKESKDESPKVEDSDRMKLLKEFEAQSKFKIDDN